MTTHSCTTKLFLAACCLLLWALGTQGAPLETQEMDLEAFETITDCLPFNLKVEPSSGDDVYKLIIEGEAPLLEAVEAKVEDGVLALGLADGFETERVIKVTVAMPKDALETIIKASTSVLVVAPGFELEELVIRASGVASVRVFDAQIDDLVVESSGSSIVFTEGRFEKARFDVSGTGRAYCYGVRSEAEVFIEDIGRVFIDAENSDVKIEGTTKGLGRVFTTDGDCDIEGTIFSASCEDIEANALPTFVAQYSCGLIVDGSIECEGGRRRAATFTSSRVDSASASTFASGSGRASASSSRGSGSSFAAASSSSSAGGSAVSSTFSSDGTFSASSSSSSSGDHRFDSLVRTGGTSGDAVAVAATKCRDEEDLSMFEEEEDA